ncbi:MAG: AraC family transcriptional regulator ligand-binding domain-containing protein [Alcanivoracaceae bacterium]|nr:AraC family transcriptional regulator ligand-binding domain-containing protein [Alcanivoracaceae bacterium]
MEKGQRDNVSRLHGIPGIYLLLLCDVMREFGFTDDDVIRELGVTRSGLLQSDSRISVLTGHVAAERATALAGERGLGFAYGLALKVTLHGSVGLVALSSPTVGAALEAGARYLVLRAPFLSADYRRDEEQVTLSIRPRQTLDTPLQTFLMESMLVGMAAMAEQLVGETASGLEVHMPGPEPDYYALFRARLPVPVLYGQADYALRGPRAFFEAAPRLADPDVAELARQQCEQEYQQLFARSETMRQRVSNHLKMVEPGHAMPSQEVMASWLHVSARTLKRRLQEEQVSYRALQEQELHQRACQLLGNPALAVSEVAYRLGYNDVANFSRAFKRWTGKTPSQFRAG